MSYRECVDGIDQNTQGFPMGKHIHLPHAQYVQLVEGGALCARKYIQDLGKKVLSLSHVEAITENLA